MNCQSLYSGLCNVTCTQKCDDSVRCLVCRNNNILVIEITFATLGPLEIDWMLIDSLSLFLILILIRWKYNTSSFYIHCKKNCIRLRHEGTNKWWLHSFRRIMIITLRQSRNTSVISTCLFLIDTLLYYF